jgi:hypothetical protein
MTMLTQDFERPLQVARPRLLSPEAEKTHVAAIKRACAVAFGLLLGGGGIAAIIALRTAIYLARFHL